MRAVLINTLADNDDALEEKNTHPNLLHEARKGETKLASGVPVKNP